MKCFSRRCRKYHVYIILHQKRELDLCGGYHNTHITIYSNLSLANLFQTRLYILPTYLSTKMTCSQTLYDVVWFCFAAIQFFSSVYIKRHQVSLVGGFKPVSEDSCTFLNELCVGVCSCPRVARLRGYFMWN